ncbi:MAG: ABC transporter ATP-binding protein/permease [Clostridiales bacterium]|nr:ABC transporter ATP-binding protein/permease [Clostridiales bacterium]
MLRRFIPYYKPHLKLFLTDMFCATFIAAVDLIFPSAIRKVLSEVLPNRQFRLFFTIVAVLAVLYGLRAAAEFFINYWGHIMGVRMEYDMRQDLFDHLQKMSFKFYDNNQTGQLMSRVTNDLFDITEMAHHGPEDLFLSVVMFIGSFIIMLRMHWKLTLIAYIFVPIMLTFAIIVRRRMRQAQRRVRRRVADINARLENSLSGIRVAKAFANEDHEREEFQKGNSEFRGAKKESYKYMGLFQTGLDTLGNVLNVTILVFGGIFFVRGEINATDILTFVLYISTFMKPITKLSNFTQQFETGMTGFERLLEILDTDPDIQDKPGAKEMTNVKGEICFNDVTFSYNENEAKVLHHIDMTIPAGKMLALVGPSGGGKTTMCHLIPRFYEVDRGSITIDGQNIQDVTMRSLRRNIGLVQQEVFLYSGTVRENIMYGRLDATEEEMIEAAKAANIHDFIMTLPQGYDTDIGQRGVRLSGGQKQRIAIARVFLKNPPILILDEATSALDNETEVKIQKALDRLAQGRTCLVIAHRLSTIKNADQIVVITSEGVTETGTHEKLLAENGTYAKLYNMQFRNDYDEVRN